jgi:hypothetical protein
MSALPFGGFISYLINLNVANLGLFPDPRDALELLWLSHAEELKDVKQSDVELALRERNIPARVTPQIQLILDSQQAQHDATVGNLCTIAFNIFTETHKKLVDDFVEEIVPYSPTDDSDHKAILLATNLLNWHSLVTKCEAATRLLRSFPDGIVVADALPEMPELPVEHINTKCAELLEKVSSFSLQKQRRLFKKAAKHIVRDRDRSTTTCLINPFLLSAHTSTSEPFSNTPTNLNLGSHMSPLSLWH